MKPKSKFKKGDLIGIGWSGITKRPFPAIITKVHSYHGDETHCYTVCILNTSKKTFVTEKDLKKFEDYLNK